MKWLRLIIYFDLLILLTATVSSTIYELGHFKLFWAPLTQQIQITNPEECGERIIWQTLSSSQSSIVSGVNTQFEIQNRQNGAQYPIIEHTETMCNDTNFTRVNYSPNTSLSLNGLMCDHTMPVSLSFFNHPSDSSQLSFKVMLASSHQYLNQIELGKSYTQSIFVFFSLSGFYQAY